MHRQHSIRVCASRLRDGTLGTAIASLALIAIACSCAIAQTPSFTLLGAGRGTGISADGSSASGYLGELGFVWTRSGGRQDLSGISANTAALGISGDGRYAVGGQQTAAPTLRAFRWSQAGGYQAIGPANNTISEAYDASFNGSTVVGMFRGNATAAQRPFRWTESGGFQILTQDVEAVARAVTSDGNTIVGETFLPNRPFVWTAAGGMQFLTALDGSNSGVARAVNFDGSIIVGDSAAPGGGRPATMWINGVPQRLLPGANHFSFFPLGVSDDGSVVCGELDGSNTAGVWTAATGAIALTDYLAMHGITVPPSISLSTCAGVSGDGLSFVGNASIPFAPDEAYVTTIPSPGVCAAVALSGLFAARRTRPHRPSRVGSTQSNPLN